MKKTSLAVLALMALSGPVFAAVTALEPPPSPEAGLTHVVIPEPVVTGPLATLATIIAHKAEGRFEAVYTFTEAGMPRQIICDIPPAMFVRYLNEFRDAPEPLDANTLRTAASCRVPAIPGAAAETVSSGF